MASELERFLSNTRVTPSGCWLWTGTCHPKGYGQFNAGGRHHRAHKWLWEHTVGPVPDGRVLDHLCRNTSCVRIAHQEPVVQRINLARGDTFVAANLAKTHCAQGHEFTPENTYRARTRWGYGRGCRTCRRRYAAESRKRARARGRSAREAAINA
jgi:hypothetical protein